MCERKILQLVTDATTEPVTTAEAKTHMRIDFTDTDNDTYIDTLIKSARIHLEAYANRAFITQTWKLILSSQPEIIRLPKGNLISVSSVKTILSDESETTESSSIYSVTTGDNGAIQLRVTDGNIWTVTTRSIDFFVITFVCGWANAAAVPSNIKTAIKQLAAHWYHQGEGEPIPEYVYNTMSRWKMWGW